MSKHLYKPGQSGNPAGKKPGTKNKVKYEVGQILADLNCNPFQILADLAMNARSEKVKCEAASELAAYCAPKLKALELSNDKESPVNFSITLSPMSSFASKAL